MKRRLQGDTEGEEKRWEIDEIDEPLREDKRNKRDQERFSNVHVKMLLPVLVQ